MRVVHTASGLVDFEKPINLRPDQVEEFRAFLAELTGAEVQVLAVSEPPRKGLSSDTEKQRWTAEGLAELVLNPNMTHRELGKLLGRGDLSIGTKRANFVPAFRRWLKDSGLTLPASRSELEDLIRQYEEDTEDEEETE
ncbi:MAG TPA: hypothetical protein VFH78_06950 [Candidatus Thermoplasmatota archaeon]|nr:hypothetical protein [Candidatus Thermoplasmatota archaeon]